MKTKKIWSADTAAKIATAKFQKYGAGFYVIPAKGGGFYVKTIAQMTDAEYAGWQKTAGTGTADATVVSDWFKS